MKLARPASGIGHRKLDIGIYWSASWQIGLLVFIGLFFPLPAYADINIGEDYAFQGAAAQAAFQDFGTVISRWLPNVFTISGLLLGGYILFGGFMYITAAGDQDKLKEGQKAINSAIIGFALLFGSYWIIQIIQVVSGIPILNSGL